MYYLLAIFTKYTIDRHKSVIVTMERTETRNIIFMSMSSLIDLKLKSPYLIFYFKDILLNIIETPTEICHTVYHKVDFDFLPL